MMSRDSPSTIQNSGEKMPEKLVVSEGQELFGLVGFRRPLKVARVRLPEAIPDMPTVHPGDR